MRVPVRTADGELVVLPDVALDGLRLAFRAGVFVEGDPGYDAARVNWNAMIDRRPAIIIRCLGTAEVIDAVNFARMRNLLVGIRAGGHSVAGLGSVEGGVLIDLSPMTGVYVDPRARTARVGGGATWGILDRETQAFRMATPGGAVSNTGVAGLTLSGGIGALRRRYGLSCDNMLSAEVVTAEGDVLRASADDNPDLYWALRGGGGNYGIVTSFEMQLHEVGPVLAFALRFYPAEDAPALLRAWRDWQASVTDDVTSHFILWSVPDLEDVPLPDEVKGREVAAVTALHAGPLFEGKEALATLASLGEPIADMSGPWPYRMVQAAFDPIFAEKGRVHAYFKSLFLDGLSDDAIDMVAKRALDRPNGWTLLNVAQMGGAVASVDPTATAFVSRQAPFMLSIDGFSFEPSEMDTVVPWVRDFWSEMQRFAIGGPYLNFLGQESADAEALTRAAHGENYERLRRVKARYDPDNWFRMNQNIPPAR